MAREILMPKLGLTMTEGTIEGWKKQAGENVRKGEVLLSVSTDKLTNDVEAAEDGILLKIVVPKGESAACGAVIAYIGAPGETLSDWQSPVQEKNEESEADIPVKRVIVVGGGPGGYVAAIRAAQLGAQVTVIEKERLGGTCLNVGCTPTKCLLHSAGLFAELRQQGAQIGVLAENLEVDLRQVMEYKRSVTDYLVSGVERLFQINRIRKVSGTARFKDKKTLLVLKEDGSTEEMSGDSIILATGSVNVALPIPGLQGNPHCMDSTGVLSLKELPKSMVVVGGGVIGLEMAYAYASFGVKITVIEALDHMLPMMDQELAEIAIGMLEMSGIAFHRECLLQRVEGAPEGVKLFCDQHGSEVILEAEKVLIAVGRKANTDGLGLEAAGIRHERGKIIVNPFMETNVPGIYAVGDCVSGFAQLAHVASAMGEVAAENIMGMHKAFDDRTSPNCIYFNPEFAGVGLTEEQLKQRGIQYTVGKFPLNANGKAVILGQSEGLVKILADSKYEEVLGVHIIGPRATEMIAEGALAIRLEATADELIDTIHAHPSLSESVREAALHVQRRAIHNKN